MTQDIAIVKFSTIQSIVFRQLSFLLNW